MPLDQWDFTIVGEVDELRRWSWDEFRALPSEEITVDIHCVTKWSKLDTAWEGISVETLLNEVETSAEYLVAFCDGGYTTNLPVADVTDGKAWVAFAYDDEPLEAEHGGPARLLVPHLYFWKSAKWVRGLDLREQNDPGFWETNGYHLYGDPWLEQRFAGEYLVVGLHQHLLDHPDHRRCDLDLARASLDAAGRYRAQRDAYCRAQKTAR